MSTEATFHYDDTDLADGRRHSLPCPSPEHEGEPGHHDVLVRFAANVTGTGACVRCLAAEVLDRALRIQFHRG